VLIHYTSPFALEITNTVEERKKKITDEVSHEVLTKNYNYYYSRTELNRKIREMLRTAFNQDMYCSMVEAVDLEANYLRVPL
jgi:hypothetical protein